MRRSGSMMLCVCAAGLLLAGRVEGATTYFVDWNRPNDSGNGQSWAAAKKTLQAAISAAAAGDTILVRGSNNRASNAAEGLYRLTSVTDTFRIDGLTIVGGMDGVKTDPEDRDPVVYETVLSGEFPGATGNAYHVVTATDDGILRGFIIENGRASSATAFEDVGAGVFIYAADPGIHECTIRNNIANDRAGGIAIIQANPTIAQCVITDNSATLRGGGTYVYAGEPIIYDCTISNNDSTRGGGVTVEGSPHLIADISGCIIEENEATNRGGGIYLDDCSAQVSHCTVEANRAPDGGGAYAEVTLSSAPQAPVNEDWDGVGPHFLYCQFIGNTADDTVSTDNDGPTGGGAAVQVSLPTGYQTDDDTEFRDCDFVDNRISYEWLNYCRSTGLGAGLFLQSSAEVIDCLFEGNGPDNDLCNEIIINGDGLAIWNYVSATQNHTAEFHNCVFRGNRHSQIQQGCPSDARQDFIHHGGGVYIQRPDGVNPFLGTLVNDAEVYDCKFIDNVAANGGGAFLDRAVALFDGCEFMGNDANGRSAHVYDDADLNSSCDGYSGTQYYTQLVAAYGGGAISTYRLSYFKLIDCKFIRNTASLWSGGAIYVYQGATMDADRCYFVGNTAPSLLDEDPPYTNNGPGTGGAIWVNTECLNGLGGCAGSGITTEHAVSNVYNSLFVGNVAAGEGGALYIERAGRSTLVNCTIMNNDAGETGGVLSDSTPRAEYYNEPCINIVHNSIVWGNTDAEHSVGDVRAQVADEKATWTPASQNPPTPESWEGWPTVNYSCVQSGLLGTPLPYVFLQDPDHNIGSSPAIPGTSLTPSPATWDSAVYDPATGLTTFTDTAATVTGWTHRILLTRSSGSPASEARSLIVSVDNSTHTVRVLGNLVDFAATYVVEDYLIGAATPCHNVGDNGRLVSPFDLLDIVGSDRTTGTVDMGCYERLP